LFAADDGTAAVWTLRHVDTGGGMAVYTAKAMLHGKGHDMWEMIVENIP
jgi:hypothetical protein